MPKKTISFGELESLLVSLDKARDLDEILRILQRQISAFGFEKLTYWVRWPSYETKKPVFISTYPDFFIDHYIESGYQGHDMVGRLSTQRNTPFVWSDIGNELPISRVQKALFDDSASAGLRAGGSIPIHGPNQVKATFSVTCNIDQREFDELFRHHKHELQIIATYAHEKIMSFGIDNPIRGKNLTQREAEILTWVARGKTYWEISQILCIQEDTVKKHMQSVFASLSVSNNTHAVAKAIINGLIIP